MVYTTRSHAQCRSRASRIRRLSERNGGPLGVEELSRTFRLDRSSICRILLNKQSYDPAYRSPEKQRGGVSKQVRDIFIHSTLGHLDPGMISQIVGCSERRVSQVLEDITGRIAELHKAALTFPFKWFIETEFDVDPRTQRVLFCQLQKGIETVRQSERTKTKREAAEEEKAERVAVQKKIREEEASSRREETRKRRERKRSKTQAVKGSK